MIPHDAAASLLGANSTENEHPVTANVDETRLRTMLDDHFDAVYHSLRRVGIPTSDLEDCTQEVFIIASDKLAVILPGRERAFLLGVAQRVAAHARRRLRRFPVLSDDENASLSMEDVNLRPDEEMERRRRQVVFTRIIETMSEDLRTVFLLFEVEELTMQEIASVLDLPPGTVASRLRRAREEFERIALRMAARSKGGRHA